MELGTTEYKRYSELAKDSNTIRQFWTAFPSPRYAQEDVEYLINDLSRGDWHKPIPKITKNDTKELPDILIQQEQEREKALDKDKERKAFVYFGLRLTYAAADPQKAADIATWLGSYFKDVVTREAVREQVQRWTSETLQFSDRALERKLKLAFDIEQAQTRATALKKIVALYPDDTRRDSQQVVDVRKDNEKFISPRAQLVGAESEVIEINEKASKLDREIEQQNFAKLMLSDAETALNQSTSGKDSVAQMYAVIERFSKSAKTEAEREKLLSLTADLSQIRARFLSQAQFVASPSVSTLPEKPRPMLVAIVGGLLFAFVAAVFTLRQMLVSFFQDQNRPGSVSTARRE